MHSTPHTGRPEHEERRHHHPRHPHHAGQDHDPEGGRGHHRHGGPPWARRRGGDAGRGAGGFGFGGPGFGPGPGGGGFGPPGFGPPGLGGPGFGGRGFRGRGRGGGRAARGDVRASVLALLSEQPRHGYQIITEISERSRGAWKPSPGSVYPVLQQLQDEGLVRPEESDGRRVFHLTDAGQAYVAEHAGDLNAPWEAVGGSPHAGVEALFGLFKQVAAAAWQVAQTGSEAQIAQAQKILADTRRGLYRILAEDEPDGEGAGEAVAGEAIAGDAAAGESAAGDAATT